MAIKASGWARFGAVVGAVLVGGLLLADPASAQVTGIRNTKHNLGTSPSGGNATSTFSGTGEVCVFCHTPHGADTGAAAPLWNRNLSTPPVYQTYDSLGTSTLDGATAVVGSVSLACLSCHDGTQAMNAVINAPGSGLTNPTFTAGTWTGAGVNPANGQMATGRVANLGTDLRNDHPIGIQYCGGGPTVAAPGTACRDTDFVAPTNQTINGKVVFWVETGGNGTRNKSDMILYNRSGTELTRAIGGGTIAGGEQPFVECASCHDPHTDTNATFLRLSNTGSAVCLACHVK